VNSGLENALKEAKMAYFKIPLSIPVFYLNNCGRITKLGPTQISPQYNFIPFCCTSGTAPVTLQNSGNYIHRVLYPPTNVRFGHRV
jgi:hypothetical protein